MIAPMKRVYIALQEKDRLAIIDALRKLGLVHLEPLEGTGETYERLVAVQKTVTLALASIEEFISKKTPAKDHENPQACAEEITALTEAIKNQEEKVAALTKEIESVYEWGDFEPELLQYLKQGGLTVSLFVMPKKKLPELDPSLEYIVIKEEKGKAYIACISKETSDQPLVIHPEAVACKLPSKRLSVLIAERIALINSITEQRQELKHYAVYYKSLKAYAQKLEKRISFEAVYSGLNTQEGIAWMAGWIPGKETDAFKAFASVNT